MNKNFMCQESVVFYFRVNVFDFLAA